MQPVPFKNPEEIRSALSRSDLLSLYGDRYRRDVAARLLVTDARAIPVEALADIWRIAGPAIGAELSRRVLNNNQPSRDSLSGTVQYGCGKR